MPKIKSVLIANRGEIAVRTIKTLKKMGIKSVSIYSDPDKNAIHAQIADISIPLGSFDSYLKIDSIIEAAKKSEADAIFPGYGFLSENSEFALACEKNGITFIGPTPNQINEFGLKHKARERAISAGIPIIKGSDLISSTDEAISIAENIGYPVMLKCTGGGGGMGLLVCRSKSELIDSFEKTKSIGRSLFKNEEIFLEKYIEHARHVEVQIFGDGLGKVAVLGLRDCSIQRRNQKILEESPAPNLPEDIIKDLYKYSKNIAESINYRSAGTVEFIYEFKKKEIYFLEVNTRIQVEHTITEETTGIDLIECMIRLASNDEAFHILNLENRTKGVAIEVRINAEDPLHNFAPNPGKIEKVFFPDNIRVDCCIENGSVIPHHYDSMIAKIIVSADSRENALKKLIAALDSTIIQGIKTNLEYVREIISSENFCNVNLSTKFLDSFKFSPRSFEIIEPGYITTIQDYPGRIKYWAAGVPPSGPMDSYSFRLANRIVGNKEDLAGIECTLNGPTLLFHCDTIIAITGGCVESLFVGGDKIPMFTPIFVKAGQQIKILGFSSGLRCYIAFRGGINVPMYLGSRSTFTLGKFGGINGNKLSSGDVVPISPSNLEDSLTFLKVSELKPAFNDMINSLKIESSHNIGIMYGPHGAPDFFVEEFMERFLDSEFEIHYNASRLGVKLIGPKPTFTRDSGGEAGLHPSNIHDCVYAIGSVNYTGDSPVILTCDGPSLGGFVCPFTIPKSELHKVGQVKSGDLVRFHLISYDYSCELDRALDKSIEELSSLKPFNPPKLSVSSQSCVLASMEMTDDRPSVTYRQAGDSNILLEYGEMVLDVSLRVRVHLLMEFMEKNKVDGVIELSPGVRSVQIQFDNRLIHQQKLINILIDIEKKLENILTVKIPSRIVYMPCAFEDSETLKAVERYKSTVRANAPWLPNNVDFIQRINGLASREEVKKTIFDCTYLVLGLGDVYLGAPCAVPLDPRHRLLTSKYNPARTHTAEGTVGIGGVYMCIYGMDSPGGYQLVGRTIPIWSRTDFKEPWLLKLFDQVRFYQVSEEELLELRKPENSSKNHRVVHTDFSYSEYVSFLNENKESILSFQEKQKISFDAEVQLWQKEEEQTLLKTVKDDKDTSLSDENLVDIKSTFFGVVWKICVENGHIVKKGQDLLIIEAMKMEIKITSTVDGEVKLICCENGQVVRNGDVIFKIKSY